MRTEYLMIHRRSRGLYRMAVDFLSTIYCPLSWDDDELEPEYDFELQDCLKKGNNINTTTTTNEITLPDNYDEEEEYDENFLLVLETQESTLDEVWDNVLEQAWALSESIGKYILLA
ncbi:uncharacterized protein LOC135395360 isoform X2 [Ornithodoros turicata]|uniref:uncharacterized protein LOC135395360 isoform X2 n=1 Tax=Ornithodoros turicata TaxID=34597 RepID=UPI003139F66E